MVTYLKELVSPLFCLHLFTILILLLFSSQIKAQPELWDYLDPFYYNGRTITGSGNELLIGKNMGGALSFNKETTQVEYYKRYYTGLVSNIISKVEVDNLGNKWFACSNVSTNNELTGICKFDGTNWTVYDSSNSPVPHEDLKYFHVDNSEVLWVGTREKGLLKLDGNAWTIYDTLNSSIPTNRIKTIASDSEGNIWFAGNVTPVKDILVKYDGLIWTTFDPDTNQIPFFYIRDILIDDNNTKWLYTTSQLIKYNDTTFNFYYPQFSGILMRHVGGMDIDTEGNLYFANIDTGVVIFDKNENWSVFNISDTADFNMTFGIYIDDENIKWLLTYKGLTKWDNTLIKHYPLSNAPVLDGIVVDTYKDEEGISYFASGGLTIYDGANWQRYDYSNSPLPMSFITSLDMDDENQLWMTTNEGLVKLQENNWTIYDTLNSNIPTHSFREVKVDNNNVKWFASANGIVKIENEQMTIYDENNAPLDGDNIYTIAFDEFNNKWFGGETCGLVKFDGNNWTVYKENSSGLYRNLIEDITFDKYGILWLTTGQAIQAFDGTHWNTFFPTSYGLPNDACNALQGDPYGNVWASLYFNGFAKIDSARNWTIYNNQNSGLLGTNQIVHRIKIDEDGYKWFCTNDGGVSIYKGDIVLNVTGDENEIPLTFRLEQNYPNPFNPTTTIKFALPVDSKVKISVYNTVGQLVETLVDKEMASGYHEVNFNASRLASGVYLYQLQAGDFISVKKMILLK
jgi:ligand-binding sensor domain-containing protein